MKKFLIVLVSVFFLATLGFFGYKFVTLQSKTAADSGKRQAVFLTSGQVYFGKIESVGSDYLVMTDIYYLKTQSDIDASVTDASKKVSIIKLGEEIHGPEDRMYINRDQILFYESMRDNSKINEAIKTYLAKQKNGTN